MELEMMRVAAPHIGVEPCAGAKTDVMGFPRVVVECLLALAQHTRGRTIIEVLPFWIPPTPREIRTNKQTNKEYS